MKEQTIQDFITQLPADQQAALPFPIFQAKLPHWESTENKVFNLGCKIEVADYQANFIKLSNSPKPISRCFNY
ncbi:MAG: hypothetical protein AAGG75_03350 [Bacteroidota bacterium]